MPLPAGCLSFQVERALCFSHSQAGMGVFRDVGHMLKGIICKLVDCQTLVFDNLGNVKPWCFTAWHVST